MINIFAPINSLGYGVAGYNILKTLYSLYPSTTLYPIGPIENIDIHECVSATIANQKQHNKDFPCVKIWHQHDLQTRIGSGRYFGFPIFELDQFSEKEVVSLHHCDNIFVCSEWAKQVISDNTHFSDMDIHVVPLGVDTDIFKPSTLKPRKPTVFLNCGKWEKRKGHGVLLESFNAAFDVSDNVELWMMCDNPFIGDQNQAWQKLYKDSPLGDKIRIIPRQVAHQDVYNIMCQADCGVFPARAEGWNLELLEMMACGKQVIATNYSAHTEFCNDENSYLINITSLETASDGVFFDGSGGQWASLCNESKDQLVSHMRCVHRKKQQGSQTINNAGIETASKFSWCNSVKELLNGLQYT